MKNFSIIVAADDKNWIWKNNDLAWRLSADLKNFKKITIDSEDWKQNAVVMWRKTWESIPEKFRPLPWRKNFILSSRSVDNETVFSDFDKFLEEVSKNEEIDKIFVIWWWEIYKSTITHKNCAKIFFTKVFWDFWCEKFFPEIPGDFIKNTENKDEVFEENWLKFIFEELNRK